MSLRRPSADRAPRLPLLSGIAPEWVTIDRGYFAMAFWPLGACGSHHSSSLTFQEDTAVPTSASHRSMQLAQSMSPHGPVVYPVTSTSRYGRTACRFLFHESKHRNVSTSIATLNRWRVRRSSHRGPPPPCVTEGSGYLGSRLVPWCLWFFSSLYWPCQTTLAGRRLGARPGRPTGRTGCRLLFRERQAGCVQTRSPIGRVRP